MMSKILLLLTLLASTCSGAERYFASGPHLGAWMSLSAKGMPRFTYVSLRDTTADVDISIADDRGSVFVHEASYYFEPRGPIFFDGLPLQISAEFRVVDADLRLSRSMTSSCGWTDGVYICTSEPSNSETYNVSNDSGLPDVRVHGSYGGQDFDLLLEDIDSDAIDAVAFSNFIFSVRYKEDKVRIKGGMGFLMLGDIGFGEIELGFYGRPYHEDVQRVPTPAQLTGYLPGDADLDGEVTFEDFLSLSSHYGERGTWGHGDFNGDLEVDFADFLTLSDGFGNVRSSNVVAVVPEPTARHAGLLAFFFLLKASHIPRRLE